MKSHRRAARTMVATLAVGLGGVSIAPLATAVVGYHTSANSIRVRAGASTQTAQINTIASSDTAIDIGCQTAGENVSVSGFGTSPIWDYLNGWGGYISDLFVQETPYQQFDSRIPRCEATTTPPPPPPPAPTPDPVGGCVNGGVKVFGARGTNDGNNATVQKTVDAIQSTIPHTSVQLYPLPYNPANIDNAGDVFSYPARYSAAVGAGVTQLVNDLLDHLNRCPGEHIVLVGYSQGADLVARAWDTVMSNGGMDRYRGRMDGLLLFGDPQFNPAQRDSIPAYSLDLGTFANSGHGGLGTLGVQTWSRSQEVNHLMHSWCVHGDPVCNSSSTTNIATFFLGALGAHGSYQNSYSAAAGQQMGNWLIGHYHLA